MKASVWLLATAILVVGCSKSNFPEASIPGESPGFQTAHGKLFEQLSEGAFQTDVVLESVIQSRNAVLALRPKFETKTLTEAMDETAEILSAVGKDLSEYIESPTSETEVQESFAAMDDKRLKAIEACNDALHNLSEATGIMESIGDIVPSMHIGDFTAIQTTLIGAIDDIIGAIRSFGGTVETDSEGPG